MIFIFSSDKSSHVTDVRLYDGPDMKLFILVGWGRSFLSVAWPTGVFLLLRISVVIRRSGNSIVGQLTESVESLFLIHQGGYHDLFVCP